ncbi:hypothetical protein M431DRAFT_292594 [Trichoderma harzianum CBS 226.95]|uniref:Uncharacterized protein n=1 Tax=Trichoderma harzianum CBS 226.95 TaxID=983964 RepID=A0A2T4APJ3_TRIHA|nr:hypothetical protein M431DRAFT_292594 [Trichoderma harzianum CBS 226.95]PTB58989.1 hypothetical protein M431DRAFT_292594 [Trichoderma harzianum CBS 226.95]
MLTCWYRQLHRVLTTQRKNVNGSKQSKLSTAQAWVKINLVLLLACCLSPCGSGRAGQWGAHQFNQSSPEAQSSVPHNWSQTPREGHRPRARPGFACPSGSQRTSRTSTLHIRSIYSTCIYGALLLCSVPRPDPLYRLPDAASYILLRKVR